MIKLPSYSTLKNISINSHTDIYIKIKEKYFDIDNICKLGLKTIYTQVTQQTTATRRTFSCLRIVICVILEYKLFLITSKENHILDPPSILSAMPRRKLLYHWIFCALHSFETRCIQPEVDFCTTGALPIPHGRD